MRNALFTFGEDLSLVVAVWAAMTALGLDPVVGLSICGFLLAGLLNSDKGVG